MAEKPIRIFAYEAQPVAVEGLRRVLESSLEFEFVGAAATPGEALLAVASLDPDVVLVSSEPGAGPDGRLARELRLASPHSRLVLWLADLESEASFLDLGFQGVIRKTRPVSALLECLRAVANGILWVEGPISDQVLGFEKRKGPPRLTPRERDIARLVASGLKNREIAEALAISPGTVKVHLMHIFEKAGVENRSQLAVQAHRLVDRESTGQQPAGCDPTGCSPE